MWKHQFKKGKKDNPRHLFWTILIEYFKRKNSLLFLVGYIERDISIYQLLAQGIACKSLIFLQMLDIQKPKLIFLQLF